MRSLASIRVRLTALYSGIFLAASIGLLVTFDLLSTQMMDRQVTVIMMSPKSTAGAGFAFGVRGNPPPLPPEKLRAFLAAKQAFAQNARYETATRMRTAVVDYQWSLTLAALAVITVLAVLAGWWLAGRTLRPLHRITATARRLSLSTLSERIALDGPRDELKELADTFDAMLERLECAVESQRRFIANASHELRTPLAIQRAAIEIGLEGASADQVAQMRRELLAANLRTERLIDGLLVLAQGERGLDRREPVRLAEVVTEAVQPHLEPADEAGITVRLDVRPAVVAGDPVLLVRLVGNLVHNAVRYNHLGGEVVVQVDESGLVEVVNTGPVVPPDRMGELFEPFRRLGAARTGTAEGAGLGLSIVAAIAQAHHAEVMARPREGGGLVVSVALQALAPATEPRSARSDLGVLLGE